MVPSPSVAEVAEKAAAFGAALRPDRSWDRLLDETAPAIDLARPAHRASLLRWLNAWTCRIRVPGPGEATPFDDAVAAWWEACAAHLPEPAVGLVDLTDRAIDDVAAAFGDLAARIVAVNAAGTPRTMGSTATAKALYALRPASLLPWDDRIARTLHGGRDGSAYAAHLDAGRAWARALLVEAGTDEAGLLAALGRPGATLPKVLDEWCFVRFTLGR